MLFIGSLVAGGVLLSAAGACGQPGTEKQSAGIVVSDGLHQDWPRFLGAAVDGRSALTGIRTDWSGDGLPLLWTIEVGQGYGIGSVADGVYYHFDAEANGDARLRTFDAATGEPQWTYRYDSDYDDMYGYDSGPRSSPLVYEDHVFLFGVEGQLHAIERETGKKVWSLDTADRFAVIQNFFGVASNPVVFGDLLLVMVGGSPPESQAVPSGALDRVKPNGSGIVAVERATGEIVYAIGDELASYTSLQIADICGQLTGVAWMREHLLLFDPADGTIRGRFRWRSKKLESVNASTPVVIGDQILLSECYEGGSVLIDVEPNKEDDAESGLPLVMTEVWSDRDKRDKSLQAHWNTPVLHEGFLYGCSGRHRGSATLRCVELETGKLQWSQVGLTRTSVTLCDGHLVVISEDGLLRLVKATPQGFEPVTQLDLAEQEDFIEPCWAAPVIAGGRLFVRGKNKVACFELVQSR